MGDICRLCCTNLFVHNDIFDEENALYLKMSLYLPIKVFKNDRLPQKICDKCSCKVNDFYQFCNEAIEVQNRLRAALLTSRPYFDENESLVVDLTLVKEDRYSPHHESITCSFSRGTQTDTETVVVKQEQPHSVTASPQNVKDEPDQVSHQISYGLEHSPIDIPISYSDDSDNHSLKTIKRLKKKHKKDKIKEEDKPVNGDIKSGRRDKKRRKKVKDYETFMNTPLPESDAIKISRINDNDAYDSMLKHESLEVTLKDEVKEEDDCEAQCADNDIDCLQTEIKQELIYDVWHCCICFAQCYTRSDMMQHYRSHLLLGNSTNTKDDDIKSTHSRKKDSSNNKVVFNNKDISIDIKDDSSSEKDTSISNNDMSGDSNSCKWCGVKFQDKDAKKLHLSVHLCRDERPYRCSLCEKTFRDVTQILKHGQSHFFRSSTEGGEHIPKPLSKRFVCDLCTEGFVYMKYLLEHRERAHPEARERKLVNRCMHCGREFSHLNSLRRHLRSHTGERNFLCNICGKALSSREHLKFHLRIHTGFKPNVCKTCGKGFVKKCNLTLHERVHSGEKPHVCSHCGKAFSQRSSLVIHERYHSGARPYVCKLCGRGFVAKGLLSMHLKTTCI